MIETYYQYDKAPLWGDYAYLKFVGQNILFNMN